MKREQKFLVEDASHTGEIRRSLQAWSQDIQFDETKTGKLSIVVNELVTNIVKHASRGEIIAVMDDNSISLLAIDKGPGISNIMTALEDGFSTHGTSGTGLGAIKRLADEFDIYSASEKGTIVLARFILKETKNDVECFGFSLPVKGETVSGDQWVYLENPKPMILVSDGLGHGLQAHEASRTSVEAFRKLPHHDPYSDVESLHNALRSTRGAAIAVAHFNKTSKIVEYCGLGNISGTIVTRSQVKKLVTYNGTAGIQFRKTQALPYPVESDSILIMHSDGLGTQWALSNYSGLSLKHPLLICGVLYRDFNRGTDDVTVVAARLKT